MFLRKSEIIKNWKAMISDYMPNPGKEKVAITNLEIKYRVKMFICYLIIFIIIFSFPMIYPVETCTEYFNTLGIKILKVAPGSKAEKAGMKENDIIVVYNGQRIVSHLQFVIMVRQAISKVINCKYIRGSKVIDIQLKRGVLGVITTSVIIGSDFISYNELTSSNDEGLDNNRINLLKLYAEKGHPQAQGYIGFLYLTGSKYIEKNSQKALSWINKATENGDLVACHNLGLIYLNGDIVEKNLEKSLYWLKRAATSGNRKSIHLFKIVEEEQKDYHPLRLKAIPLQERKFPEESQKEHDE